MFGETRRGDVKTGGLEGRDLHDGPLLLLPPLVFEQQGAADVATIAQLLKDAGFENVQVAVQEASREFIRDWMPDTGFENYVASATIEATKPGRSNSWTLL